MSGNGGISQTLDAHAKVNLHLQVLARRTDGYHSIETLLLRAGPRDRVTVGHDEPGIQLVLSGNETGDGAAAVPGGGENLCWQAAEAFLAEIGERPAVRIELEKRIPPGTGLGGGSADAAATLRALDRLYGSPVPEARLMWLAGELGSDVPFQLLDVPMALAWGRGERLLPLRPPPPRPALILLPPIAVATAEAYGWLGPDLPLRAGYLPGTGRLDRWETLERMAGNAFEDPVTDRHPVLREGLETLNQAGARIAMMSGSGSALFGIFTTKTDRERAEERIDEWTGWRSIRTTIPAGA